MPDMYILDKGIRRETYAGKAIGDTARSDNRRAVINGVTREDGTYVSPEDIIKAHNEIMALMLQQ